MTITTDSVSNINDAVSHLGKQFRKCVQQAGTDRSYTSLMVRWKTTDMYRQLINMDSVTARHYSVPNEKLLNLVLSYHTINIFVPGHHISLILLI